MAISMLISTRTAPQMHQLLEFDRSFSLRFFVFVRTWLFEFFQPDFEKDKKAIKYQSQKTDLDFIGSWNLKIQDFKNSFARPPKEESKYEDVLNSMVNMFFLHIIENIPSDDDKSKYAADLLNYFDKTEMVFGPIENENLINYLTKLSQKDQSTTNAIFKIADEINKLEEPTVSSRLLDSEKFDVAAIESISIDQSLEKDIQKVLITRKEVAKFYKISLTYTLEVGEKRKHP